MASSFLALFIVLCSFSPLPSLALSASVPHSQPPSTSFLAPILSNLGFQELAIAVPSVISSVQTPGPITIFAPSDDSVRSCSSSTACSPSRLLKEHLVPGIFPISRLSQLPFGTKLQTAAPNRCLTVTSTSGGSKLFVDGVEITHHDVFNDGNVVIHGLQGFIAPLSPSSCVSDEVSTAGSNSATMMLRDAIVRLRERGFSILSLAMRIKSPELMKLEKMTVFALDDVSIFGGGGSYVHEVRFHVVPNQLLRSSDLAKLPEGTVLRTLVRGQHLVVTQSAVASPLPSTALRINYVPIRAPDVVLNSRIVVHALFFPFPHLYLADLAQDNSEMAAADGMVNTVASSPAFLPTVPHASSAETGVDCVGGFGGSGEFCGMAPAVPPVVKLPAV